MGNADVMTVGKLSDRSIGVNGEIKSLELNGSKKQQIQQSLDYFQDLQTELCNEVATKEEIQEKIKQIQQKLKTSPLLAALKTMKKDLRTRSANISEINSRRSGALGLCKKQGLDLTKHLKNVIQIQEGK